MRFDIKKFDSYQLKEYRRVARLIKECKGGIKLESWLLPSGIIIHITKKEAYSYIGQVIAQQLPIEVEYFGHDIYLEIDNYNSIETPYEERD